MSNLSARRSTTLPLPSSPHCAPRTIMLFILVVSRTTDFACALLLYRAQRTSPVRPFLSRTTDFACALLITLAPAHHCISEIFENRYNSSDAAFRYLPSAGRGKLQPTAPRHLHGTPENLPAL